MRVHTVLAVAAISLVAVSGCNRAKKAFSPGPPPTYPGSYAQSCRNITTLSSGFISAECADEKGKFVTSYIQAAGCHGDIGNSNGMLVCNGATASTTPPKTDATSSDTASDQAASDAPASSAAPVGLK